jgi:hypothetical protein
MTSATRDRRFTLKEKIKVPFHTVDFSHIVGFAAQHVSISDVTAGPHVIVILRADKK